MKLALFFATPGNEQLAQDLAELTSGEVGELELRRFPDGETYVRIASDVKGRDVFLVCTLANPDPQFLGLSFAASELRRLGSRRVELIAPYLAYMRQDRIFHPGEALTSRMFAELIQRHFDRLTTVDPHLHRHATLDEVYDITSTVVHAGALFALWIAEHVQDPVVIGPDAESAQWVESIALEAGAPWTVFQKERRGDREVRVKASDLFEHRGRTPVIIDDIVSSGTTMKQALRALLNERLRPAYCLAIHALCSRRIAQQISDNSAGFLTSNTVPNANSEFDIAPLIADVLVTTAARNASYAA